MLLLHKNKLNKRADIFSAFLQYNYILSCHSNNSGKNADFAEWYERKSVSVCFCVATIEVCVFRCVDLGWRTFLISLKCVNFDCKVFLLLKKGGECMKEYAIEQRRFNEKFFGRGTRNIDSVEGLLNKYAQEGWSLHTMMTTPTRDEKTQLTTMVFVRERP